MRLIKLSTLICFLTLYSTGLLADVGFTNSTYSAQEDSGTITVLVELALTDPSNCLFIECYDEIAVGYSISSGSATANSDFTPQSGTLRWNEVGLKTFNIAISPDSTFESNETINLNLNSCVIDPGTVNEQDCSQQYNINLTPNSAIAVIVNDDTAPSPGTIRLDNSSFIVSEGEQVSLTVTRSNGSTGAISIDYATSDNNASANEDYTPKSGTLSWNDGESGSKTITIPILSDLHNEQDESFNLTLSNPTGGVTLASPSSANITIQNVETTPGEFRLDSSSYIIEEGGQITVTVQRNNGSAGPVSVNYSTSDNSAIANQDYSPQSGTLSWLDGETAAKSITLTSLSDSDNENDETFTLTLSNPEGGAALGSPSSASITIQNIETPTPGEFKLNSSSYIVEEGGQVTITVQRSNGNTGAVSVSYSTSDNSAIANQDYSPQSGILSWLDGETAAKSIILTSLSDFDNENDETFSLTLSNPEGGATLGSPSNADIVIQNITTAGEIGFDSNAFSVLEGGQVTLSVSRSNGSAGVVTVNYTTIDGSAISNEDYTSESGTLSWENGESGTKTITVRTLTDAAIEDNELFSVTLSNPTGNATLTTTSASIEINNTSKNLSGLEGLTDNQKSVAKAIDNVCSTAKGQLSERCNELYNSGLSDNELKEALDSIVPSQAAAQGSVAIDFGFQQLQVIHGRITSLRSKDKNKEFSLSGFALNSFGQYIPVGQIAESLIYNAMNDATGEEPLRDSPLGFFIKGQINIGDKNQTLRERGFDVDTKSITLGLDYQFTNDLVLGVAGGYGHTQTDFDNNGGEMETHSGNFSTYGSYFLPKDFYLDWVLSYSFNDYDTTRGISYTGLSTTARSNPMGDQYGGSIGFGKDFYVKNFFINPYARFEYLRTGIDEYSERGGNGWALRISEQRLHSMSTTLGGQISQSISMPWGIISPGIRFEWKHQFMDDDRTIQSQFIDAEPGTESFTIRTDTPDRDYFNLGASLGITLPEGRAAFIRYETRLGQNDISNQTIEAAIRIPF